MRFEDRRRAGVLLGLAVVGDSPVDPVVYGLPRGGVPVAFEVAEALQCPLDVLVVAKVGLPYQPELALGAVAESGVTVRNRQLLDQVDISDDEFEVLARQAQAGLAHDWRTRADMISPKGRTAVIVDDGLATGATARAAVSVVRQQGAGEVWLAVPVAPRTVDVDVDRFIALSQPARFLAVGVWYDDFAQTSDREVRVLLERARLR